MVLSLYEDESTHGSIASLDKELFDQDSVKDNLKEEESKKATRSKRFNNGSPIWSIEAKQTEAATRSVLWKKCVLRNFTKFTEKYLYQSLLFWLTCFPMNFVKFLRKPFLLNTSGRLHLKRYKTAFPRETSLQRKHNLQGHF